MVLGLWGHIKQGRAVIVSGKGESLSFKVRGGQAEKATCEQTCTPGLVSFI